MSVESVGSPPHPVLDNSKRMMRIIANPLYDQLTVSRAAHIRQLNAAEYNCELVRLNRRRKNAMITSGNMSNNQQWRSRSSGTFYSPLACDLREFFYCIDKKELVRRGYRCTEAVQRADLFDLHGTMDHTKKRGSVMLFLWIHAKQNRPTLASDVDLKIGARVTLGFPERYSTNGFTLLPLSTSKNEVNPNPASERQPLFLDRSTSQSKPTKSTSAHLSTSTNSREPPSTSTIRYVKSRHGFEIQRYSSSNWLSVDLLSNDACQSHEKTFQEMLEKQEQHVILPRETYTLNYYRRRYEDLLKSHKQGHLTHDQWAKQNYQLHCLKTLHAQTFNREQHYLDLHAQKQRQRHAQQVFKEWKDAKAEGKNGGHRSHSKTNDTHQATERISVSSNPSFSLRSNTTHRLSSSTFTVNALEEPSVLQSTSSLKDSMKTLYMLDNRRSSLQAMLRRVVGLEESLPPPPKISTRPYSSKTILTEHSRIDSNS